MRAACYLRLSQDRDGDGLGVERQQQDCLNLVRQRGWRLAGEPYVDNDRSAAGHKPREQFTALLAAVRAGEVDAVVAWALDRLTRTARDRLALVEACQQHGVIIALVRGSDMDPNTPAGRLTLGILGEVAQHEIDAKSDRQRRAAEQAADQGRWIGGRKPFGYSADGVTIIESEAQAVRDGYSAVLAGDSLRAIAAEWNRRGFTTGQRPWRHTELGVLSPWRADSVRRVLANPRYAGRRPYRGREHGPAVWPAIVPEETFRAVQRVLSDPNRYLGGGTAARQFLSGLAVCGCAKCGATVHGGGASHRKPIYRCSASREPGERRTPVPGVHVNRLAAPADDYVADVVIERLSRPDARDLLVDHTRPDVPALREEATAFRSRLVALAAEFAEDAEVSPAEYRAMRKTLAARVAAIEDQIADAGRTDLFGPLILAEHVETAWADLSPDRRRAVVDALMIVRLHPVGRGSRTFRPDTVEIEWRNV
ncbi:recombinase family protein [Pseudonocardia sp. Cha107L01]|uniref:recombinase family protein n=1 Tax=Pseudonocardia sp. Cha107L01 TaxID=3457576 RepID=UPI00403ED4BB